MAISSPRASASDQHPMGSRVASSLAATVVFLAMVSLIAPASSRAAFPGANGRIAFSANPPPESDFEIFTLNADGTDVLTLTANSATDNAAAWSPDGTKIAFRTTRDGPTPEIYTMNADGTNQTRLTNNTAIDSVPAWSPDGTKIAFYSTRDAGNAEIYTMNADGTSPTRLTSNSGSDQGPAWSPDGTKIAFYSNRDGNDEIYTMSADGTNQTRLTNNSAVDSMPDWSPEGTKIVFFSHRDGNDEIYKMNADGSNQTRITNSTAADENPVWSPDGTRIAFDTDRDGNFEIYTMNADGTNPLNLLANFSSSLWSDLLPDWQPVLRNYARPKAASPMRLSLTPAYKQCGTPNTAHQAPLNFTSCNPPQPTSRFLTVGTPDYNGNPANSVGSVRFTVSLAAPEDGLIDLSFTDVRCQGSNGGCAGGALSDYTGDLRFDTAFTVTDKLNGGVNTSGTVTDFSLRFPVPCTPTASTTVGSTCAASTTINSVLGSSAIVAGKRAIWQPSGEVKIYDGGASGASTDPNPTLFAVSGLFFP
jgi:Tol biopolymer transport system component